MDWSRIAKELFDAHETPELRRIVDAVVCETGADSVEIDYVVAALARGA